MTVENIGSGNPSCPDAVEIMMVTPNIPSSTMFVTVNSNTSCESARPLILTRAYYTAMTGRIDGFGGMFYESVSGACPAPSIPGCIPYSPLVHMGSPLHLLIVTYSGFGYNFSESVYLP